MTRSEPRDIRPSVQDVALIIGGGPGISSSCAKLFAENGMRVGIAARNPDKPVLQQSRDDARRASIRLRCKRTSSRGAAVPECCSRPWGAYACGAQHRWPGSRHFSQGDCRSRPGHGARNTSELGVQRIFGWSAGRSTHARQPSQRQRRERNDHLHERQRGAQRFPVERRLCDGVPCQVRPRREHGTRTNAAGDPRCQCADRRRDWLDPGRRYPRASAGGNDCRRQHGRPRPHRGNLSAAPSTASVDMGIRSRAPTLARKMVTRHHSSAVYRCGPSLRARTS